MAFLKKYGWKESKLDGTEQKFQEIKSFRIPEEYTYIPFLPKVENQGSTNMCVTYAIAAHIDWNLNVDNAQDNTTNNHIDKHQIYSIRKIKGDNGMSFKEALHFLRHEGVNTDLGVAKITKYAMVGSVLALKQALLLNGPCIAGLIVRAPEAVEFWNGPQNYGGHAIAFVGYNREGFIIRNSWGPRYGNQGYSILKYADFDKVLECWTIID